MNDALRTLTAFAAQRTKSVLTRTAIPRLDLYRINKPTQLFPEIYQPFVSLILQGSKRLLIGNQILNYAAGDTFIASVALPAIGEITDASDTTPYLATLLTFDLEVVADLLRHTPGPLEVSDTQSFGVDPASDDLIDAWLRMLRLMDQPDDIAVMAPLLEREILFRLLRGPQGAVLRQAASADDRYSQIRKAVLHIRTNYAIPFLVNELAQMANMSSSAFHRGFKASTGLSPLQYQKHLRLYEARRLLFANPGDVAAVAFAVGYESLTTGLLVKPGIRVGGRGVGCVAALLAVEVALGIASRGVCRLFPFSARAAAVSVATTCIVLGLEALHAGPGFDQGTVHGEVLIRQQRLNMG